MKIGIYIFFSISHRKKRMRQLQHKIKTGKLDLKEDDPFELFVAATNIRYCYYNETHKILGSTYGMCVLQVWDSVVLVDYKQELVILHSCHHQAVIMYKCLSACKSCLSEEHTKQPLVQCILN